MLQSIFKDIESIMDRVGNVFLEGWEARKWDGFCFGISWNKKAWNAQGMVVSYNMSDIIEFLLNNLLAISF